MEQGIYKGYVAGIGETYTAYMTAKEFSSFMESASGVYAGIGVQMTIDKTDNSISITEVFEGSPAQKAGILAKDKIVGADGTPLNGDDFSLAPELIKGKEGTDVIVSIYRPSENETYDFTITRENVVYPSVDYDMLPNNIGYVELRSFEELTYSQMVSALDDLGSQGMRGLILDLRDNPGGLLNSAEVIVDEFISSGTIVSVKDNSGDIKTTTATSDYNNIPMVILVNEQSASASEVVSGALKDHGRAQLVGTRTYGKGIVQTILPLTDGSAIKLTTAEYYTPSNICIQGIGIEPDHFVEMPVDLMFVANLTYEEDVQLQKAIEVLELELQ